MPRRERTPRLQSARPAGRRLTRRRILRAGLALIQREGADALTMRRLADELGAGVMSLYHHVPDREALLDGISELLVRGVHVDRETPDLAPALRQFMHGIRDVARAHPEAFRLVGMRPLATPAALPPIEALLAAARAAGQSRAEAFYTYRTAAAFARGFALAEILGFTLEPGGTDRPLDPRLPTIVDVLAEAASTDNDAAFAFGVDVIVAGITGSAP